MKVMARRGIQTGTIMPRMELLDQALAGIATVAAGADEKHAAGEHLRRWLTDPAFAPYRPQLEWLIARQQWAGLLDRFYQILPFGTGGRRGAVGIGPNRFNPWSLATSVQGHCEYLRERFPAESELRVVIAYDVRQFEDQRRQYDPDLPNPVLHLSSRQFAREVACVYAANGITAHLPSERSPRYLATPELSYTIRVLAAHGGLNISASHNPPDDNGGKFYDERGGQPIPPDDQIMADLASQVSAARMLPWDDAVRSGRIRFLDDGPHRAYIELSRRQSVSRPPRFDEFQVVFTPLHGVGASTAMEVLIAQGFRVRPVEEQMEANGQFPNVTQSPNPEVPASMDRAAALAQQLGADLVLATDPDADRLGAMVPDDTRTPRFLTGNQIAALLTHFKLAKLAENGVMPRRPIVCRSLVTTGLVTRIARHFGAQVVDDLLVGFKYIADVLWQLERHGAYGEIEGSPADFVLGCEESHGMLLTPELRDKDAAGAALLLAELALEQKRLGGTVLAYLEQIERQFGYFHNELRTIVMPGIEGRAQMARLLAALRSAPPANIGTHAVTGVEDLQDERGPRGPLQGDTDRAARNFLVLHLGDQARVSLRPSGTEPKAKAYIEVASPPWPAGISLADWRQRCRDVDRVATELAEAFMQLCTAARPA
jgi:phosphoglucomutase/phosphomannomutase